MSEKHNSRATEHFNKLIQFRQEAYAVLAANGKDLAVNFMRVPYEVERAAQAIEAIDMPSEYAEMLRTGTG